MKIIIDTYEFPEIETDPNRCGGKPVLRGTRFTIAQVLAELSDGEGIKELSEDMVQSYTDLQGLLRGLARKFDVKRQINE